MSKRRKTCDITQVEMLFETAALLKDFFAPVCHVLDVVPLRIREEENTIFEGIRVNVLSPNKSVAIIGRLSCIVTVFSKENIKDTVNVCATDLMKVLNSFHNSNPVTMKIVQSAHTTRLVLKGSVLGDKEMNINVVTLALMVGEYEDVTFSPLEYNFHLSLSKKLLLSQLKLYGGRESVIEFNVFHSSTLCKKSVVIKIDNVDATIEDSTVEFTIEDIQLKNTELLISEALKTNMFPEPVCLGTSGTCSTEDDSEMLLNTRFSASFLKGFLEKLKLHNGDLHMLLHQSSPLLINYRLPTVGTESHIRFIIGQK